MNEQVRIRAIVQNGHLVPIDPVSLTDGVEVSLTIHAIDDEPSLNLMVPAPAGPRRDPSVVMDEIAAKINRQGDGLGHVHHDEVLYGWEKTP